MSYNKLVLELLKSYFGFDQFRPLQEDIIASVLARQDTLVLMPTGGGKSLCYQLPALRFDGLTLVVSPLIALMKDQVDALKANGIAAEFINSTLAYAEINRVQAQAKSGQLKILYLAPERLASPGFRDFLKTLRVSLIAIDEAHCISEWGHDFRPDYRNLKTLRRDFPEVPVIALTATATERVREDIAAQLDLRPSQQFVASFNRANLSYTVWPKRNAFESLLALLERYRGESAIIYCFSRKDTESLATDLRNEGISALPYHAGLDSKVRQRAQEKFIRDEVPIIVATIAFGMGIDKPNIRLVAHYDLPKSLEGYYQETGRAGRDGLPSECVLFYSYGDRTKHEFFIGQIEDDTERRNAQEKLDQVIEFCNLQVCRRRYLLEYFGETWEQEGCDGCDICLSAKEEFDATVITQKILSAVVRTGERFGMGHISGVLRGANTKGIRQNQHDRLSVYGIVDDLSDDEIKDITALLLARGLLAKNGGQYPTLGLTKAGWQFLKKREQLTLTRPKRQTETESASRDRLLLAYDKRLFQKLRELRKSIADLRGVPPYVIFSDATLQHMAYYLPQSRDSLSRISGVGAVKLEQLGDDFLAAIRQYARETGQAERKPPASRRERAVKREGSTYDVTKKLLLEGLSISEIAQQRGRSEGTIIGHLERLVESGEDLDLEGFMPSQERLAKIRDAFRKAGTLALAPVRDLLGNDYSYEELRLARLYLRQRDAVPS
jgi:ATP-dependent DNA helicase RecQ